MRERAKAKILFRLRTVEANEEQVGHKVAEAFAGSSMRLVQQSLTHGELTPIAAPSEDDSSAEAPDVRFAGGQRVDVQVEQPILAASLAATLEDSLEDYKPDGAEAAPYADAEELFAVRPQSADSPTGKTTQFVVETSPAIAATDVSAVLALVNEHYQDEPAFEEKTTFDASVAGDTQRSALVAICLSNLAIIFYLWFRFQRATFGIAAVIAVMHDVTIVLGMLAIGALLSATPIGPLLALSDFKIDLSIVAAFLTIIGYSLNDTIVVFDRIREVRGKNPAITDQMVNLSLNQTLSRTVLTSGTTIIVLSILYFLGGEGVHGFSYCMLLGIIVGTFSSIFIASPALIWLSNQQFLADTSRTARPVAVSS